MKLIVGEKAVVMDKDFISYDSEQWQELADREGKKLIRSPQKTFVVPEVIRLTDFDQVINKPINLTRQNILLRDDFSCQYCGTSDDLTIDHIIPRSRASEFNMTSEQMNSWENMTTCCGKCNCKKGNKLVKEAGMVLLTKAKRPSHSIMGFEKGEIKPTWKTYLEQGKKK